MALKKKIKTASSVIRNRYNKRIDADELISYFSNNLNQLFYSEAQQDASKGLNLETREGVLTTFYQTYIQTILSGLSADYSIVQDILSSQKIQGGTAAFKVISSGQISDIVRTFIQSKLRDLESRAIAKAGEESINLEMTIRALAFLSPPGSGKTQGITSTISALLKSEKNPDGVIKDFLVYDLNRHNPVTAPLAGMVPVGIKNIISNLVIEGNNQSVMPKFDRQISERIPALGELATGDFFKTVIQTYKTYIPHDKEGNALVDTNKFIRTFFEENIKEYNTDELIPSNMLFYIEEVRKKHTEDLKKEDYVKSFWVYANELLNYNTDVKDFVLAARIAIAYVLYNTVLKHVYMTSGSVSKYYNIYFLNNMFKVCLALALVIIAKILRGIESVDSIVAFARSVEANLNSLLNELNNHISQSKNLSYDVFKALDFSAPKNKGIYDGGVKELRLGYILQEALARSSDVENIDIDEILNYVSFGTENPTAEMLRGYQYGAIENVIIYCLGNKSVTQERTQSRSNYSYSKYYAGDDLGIQETGFFSSHIDDVIGVARFYSNSDNAAQQAYINKAVSSFRKLIGEPEIRNISEALGTMVTALYKIINNGEIGNNIITLNDLGCRYQRGSMSYFSKSIMNKSLLSLLKSGTRGDITDTEAALIYRGLILYMLRSLGIVDDEVYVEAVDSRLPLAVEDLLARARRDLELYFRSLAQGQRPDFPLYVIFFDEILTHLTPINFGIFQAIWTSLIEGGKDKFPLNVIVILAGNMASNSALMKAILTRDSEGIKQALEAKRSQVGASADAFGALSDRLNFYLVTYDYSYLLRQRYDGYTSLGKQIGDYLANRAASIRLLGRDDKDIRADFDAGVAGNFDYYKAVVSKRDSDLPALERLKLEILISSFLLGPLYRSIYKNRFLAYKTELLKQKGTSAEGQKAAENDYNKFEKSINMMIDVLHNKHKDVNTTRMVKSNYKTIWSHLLRFLRDNPKWRDAYQKMYSIAMSPVILYVSAAHSLAEYNNAINDIVDVFTEDSDFEETDKVKSLSLLTKSILILNGTINPYSVLKDYQNQASQINAIMNDMNNNSYGDVIKGLLFGYAAVLFANYLITMENYNPNIIKSFRTLYEKVINDSAFPNDSVAGDIISEGKKILDKVLVSKVETEGDVKLWGPVKALANNTVRLYIARHNFNSMKSGAIEDRCYIVIESDELREAVKGLILFSMATLIPRYEQYTNLKQQTVTSALTVFQYIGALYLALYKGFTLKGKDGSAVIPGLRNMTTWLSTVDNSVNGYILSMILLALVVRYKTGTEEDILSQFLNMAMVNSTELDNLLIDLKRTLITYSDIVFTPINKTGTDKSAYVPTSYNMIAIEGGVLANIEMPVSNYYGRNAYELIQDITSVSKYYSGSKDEQKHIIKEVDNPVRLIDRALELIKNNISGAAFDVIHLLAGNLGTISISTVEDFDSVLLEIEPTSVFQNNYKLGNLIQIADFKSYSSEIINLFEKLSQSLKNNVQNLWPEFEKLLQEGKELHDKINSVKTLSIEHFISGVSKGSGALSNIPDGIFSTLSTASKNYDSLKPYLDAWYGNEKEKIIGFAKNIFTFLKTKGDYKTISIVERFSNWLDAVSGLLISTSEQLTSKITKPGNTRIKVRSYGEEEVEHTVSTNDLLSVIHVLGNLEQKILESSEASASNKYEKQLDQVTAKLIKMAAVRQMISVTYGISKNKPAGAAKFLTSVAHTLTIYVKPGETDNERNVLSVLAEKINGRIYKDTRGEIRPTQTSSDDRHLVRLCFDNPENIKPEIDTQNNIVKSRTIMTQYIYRGSDDNPVLWIDMHHIPIKAFKTGTGATVSIREPMLTIRNDEETTEQGGKFSYRQLYMSHSRIIPRYIFAPSIIVHSTLAAGIFMFRESLNSNEEIAFQNKFTAFLLTNMYLYYKKTLGEEAINSVVSNVAKVQDFIVQVLDIGNKIPLHPLLAELLHYYNYALKELKAKLERDYGVSAASTQAYSDINFKYRMFSNLSEYSVIPDMYSVMEPAVIVRSGPESNEMEQQVEEIQ